MTAKQSDFLKRVFKDVLGRESITKPVAEQEKIIPQPVMTTKEKTEMLNMVKESCQKIQAKFDSFDDYIQKLKPKK